MVDARREEVDELEVRDDGGAGREDAQGHPDGRLGVDVVGDLELAAVFAGVGVVP